MNQKSLFESLQDWENVVSISPVKRSSGRNVRSGVYHQTTNFESQMNICSTQQKMIRTIQKTPEVMVKISGGGKNMRHIQSHMDYISRHGEVELEDEKGNLYQGKDDLSCVRDMWSRGRIGIPEISEKRKEAFNIVLSMPPGTDCQAVLDAARNFAQIQFKDHQYVFAAHNDEKHPHVHLCVKAVDCRGIRLNPRKGNLQHWREHFAEKLRDQGIAANATPRRARGIVQKADKQVIRRIDHEFKRGRRSQPSIIQQAQRQAAIHDIKTDEHHINPAQDVILKKRKKLQKAYGYVAKALMKEDHKNQKLALNIIDFVKKMPPLLTKHESLIHSLDVEINKASSHNLTQQPHNYEHSNLER